MKFVTSERKQKHLKLSGNHFSGSWVKKTSRTTGHLLCPCDRGIVRTSPDSPPPPLLDTLLQEERSLSGHSPVSRDGHGSERRFTGCVDSKWTGKKNRCVLRFFLVSFVLFHEALEWLRKVPGSYSNFGTECSLHQHQNCCRFYCTYCIYWDSLQRELYEE